MYATRKVNNMPEGGGGGGVCTEILPIFNAIISVFRACLAQNNIAPEQP